MSKLLVTLLVNYFLVNKVLFKKKKLLFILLLGINTFFFFFDKLFYLFFPVFQYSIVYQRKYKSDYKRNKILKGKNSFSNLSKLGENNQVLLCLLGIITTGLVKLKQNQDLCQDLQNHVQKYQNLCQDLQNLSRK